MVSLRRLFVILTAAVGTLSESDVVEGTFNEIHEENIQGAMECLSQWCANNYIFKDSKVRCVQGDAVVYACNYGYLQTCDGRELRKSYEHLKKLNQGSMTGYMYFSQWKKTLGYDRWCPKGECNSGFKEGQPGEHCTNTAMQEWQVDIRSEHGRIVTMDHNRLGPEHGNAFAARKAQAD